MSADIKVGARVRSKGALYIQDSRNAMQYRKVHEGEVLSVLETNDMGKGVICKVRTMYGITFVNPSQLEVISL